MIAGPIECPRRQGSLSYGLLIVSLVADPVIVDSVSPGDGVTDVYSQYSPCLLYTSDAADDQLCVDLVGRRIIKKKKQKKTSK